MRTLNLEQLINEYQALKCDNCAQDFTEHQLTTFTGSYRLYVKCPMGIEGQGFTSAALALSSKTIHELLQERDEEACGGLCRAYEQHS